jgi:proline iminopeptidase
MNKRWACFLILFTDISITAALFAQTPVASDSTSFGYIEVDGSKLQYSVRGEGRPCLVIGSSVYYPRTFSTSLYRHLKFYFVDMKWFAKDYAPEKLDSVNIRSIVDDVEEIRRKLRLDVPLIMGHSIHGTIASEYVKRYPGKVAGLIIIGSPCEWGNAVYNAKSKALWEKASAERKKLQEENWGNAKEIDRLTGKEEAAKTYNTMSPQYWYNPRYDANWLWDGMTVHSELTAHLFTKVFLNYNMFNPAVKINIPVFVALGKFDYVIPYTLWQTSYESVPDFRMTYFKKSGHTPQLEEADHFNQVLLNWLKTKFTIR